MTAATSATPCAECERTLPGLPCAVCGQTGASHQLSPMDEATTLVPRRRRASEPPTAVPGAAGSPPWRRLLAGAAVCGVVGFGLAWAVDAWLHAGAPAPSAVSARSAPRR